MKLIIWHLIYVTYVRVYIFFLNEKKRCVNIKLIFVLKMKLKLMMKKEKKNNNTIINEEKAKKKSMSFYGFCGKELFLLLLLLRQVDKVPSPGIPFAVC